MVEWVGVCTTLSRAVWANAFVGSEADSRHYVILVYGTIGVWALFKVCEMRVVVCFVKFSSV